MLLIDYSNITFKIVTKNTASLNGKGGLVYGRLYPNKHT